MVAEEPRRSRGGDTRDLETEKLETSKLETSALENFEGASTDSRIEYLHFGAPRRGLRPQRPAQEAHAMHQSKQSFHKERPDEEGSKMDSNALG